MNRYCDIFNTYARSTTASSAGPTNTQVKVPKPPSSVPSTVTVRHPGDAAETTCCLPGSGFRCHCQNRHQLLVCNYITTDLIFLTIRYPVSMLELISPCLYSSDGGCSSWVDTFEGVPDNNQCTTYLVSSSNSASIAACVAHGSDTPCSCYFFAEHNCHGKAMYKSTGPGKANCASNLGVGVQSFRCFYH